MPITNFNDDFFKNLPANHDGSRYLGGTPHFDAELDEEKETLEALPTNEEVFARGLDDYPFLCVLADGQYTFEQVADALGLPDRTVAWKRWQRRRKQLARIFRKKHPD